MLSYGEAIWRLMNPVKMRRQQLGLTLRQLSTRSGVCKNTVHNVEVACHVPSAATLEALGIALSVSPQTLADEISRWHSERPDNIGSAVRFVERYLGLVE